MNCLLSHLGSKLFYHRPTNLVCCSGTHPRSIFKKKWNKFYCSVQKKQKDFRDFPRVFISL